MISNLFVLVIGQGSVNFEGPRLARPVTMGDDGQKASAVGAALRGVGCAVELELQRTLGSRDPRALGGRLHVDAMVGRVNPTGATL